jgi:hypothetical protein
MGLAQTDCAVEEQGVVVFAGVVADGDATGVRQAIARPYDEILESVIEVQPRHLRRQRILLPGDGRIIDGKAHADEMSCDLLSSAGEGILAVIGEKTHLCFIRAADIEMTACKMTGAKLGEPLARVGGVNSFRPLQYVAENVGYIRCCQADPSTTMRDATKQLFKVLKTDCTRLAAATARPPKRVAIPALWQLNLNTSRVICQRKRGFL